jgi:hypothetical protein
MGVDSNKTVITAAAASQRENLILVAGTKAKRQ